jgi:hypothetical protein
MTNTSVVITKKISAKWTPVGLLLLLDAMTFSRGLRNSAANQGAIRHAARNALFPVVSIPRHGRLHNTFRRPHLRYDVRPENKRDSRRSAVDFLGFSSRRTPVVSVYGDP